MKTRILFAAVAASILTLAQDAQAQWWNPVVVQTVPQTTVSQNLFVPHTHIHTHQDQVHVSAFSPGRNQIAPGSLRQVNYTFVGADGAMYRRHGYTWRSAVTGRPHSELTTTRISGGFNGSGFVTQSDSVTSHRTVNPMHNTQNRNRNQQNGFRFR